MTKLLISCALFFSSSAALADNNKCFNNSNLKERKEFFEAYRRKDPSGLDKKFNSICEKHPEKLACSVETVEKSKAADRMRELSKQGRCTEVWQTENGSMATIYFLNDKTVSKK